MNPSNGPIEVLSTMEGEGNRVDLATRRTRVPEGSPEPVATKKRRLERAHDIGSSEWHGFFAGSPEPFLHDYSHVFSSSDESDASTSNMVRQERSISKKFLGAHFEHNFRVTFKKESLLSDDFIWDRVKDELYLIGFYTRDPLSRKQRDEILCPISCTSVSTNHHLYQLLFHHLPLLYACRISILRLVGISILQSGSRFSAATGSDVQCMEKSCLTRVISFFRDHVTGVAPYPRSRKSSVLTKLVSGGGTKIRIGLNEEIFGCKSFRPVVSRNLQGPLVLSLANLSSFAEVLLSGLPSLENIRKSTYVYMSKKWQAKICHGSPFVPLEEFSWEHDAESGSASLEHLRTSVIRMLTPAPEVCGLFSLKQIYGTGASLRELCVRMNGFLRSEGARSASGEAGLSSDAFIQKTTTNAVTSKSSVVTPPEKDQRLPAFAAANNFVSTISSVPMKAPVLTKEYTGWEIFWVTLLLPSIIVQWLFVSNMIHSGEIYSGTWRHTFILMAFISDISSFGSYFYLLWLKRCGGKEESFTKQRHVCYRTLVCCGLHNSIAASFLVYDYSGENCLERPCFTDKPSAECMACPGRYCMFHEHGAISFCSSNATSEYSFHCGLKKCHKHDCAGGFDGMFLGFDVASDMCEKFAWSILIQFGIARLPAALLIFYQNFRNLKSTLTELLAYSAKQRSKEHEGLTIYSGTMASLVIVFSVYFYCLYGMSGIFFWDIILGAEARK